MQIVVVCKNSKSLRWPVNIDWPTNGSILHNSNTYQCGLLMGVTLLSSIIYQCMLANSLKSDMHPCHLATLASMHFTLHSGYPFSYFRLMQPLLPINFGTKLGSIRANLLGISLSILSDKLPSASPTMSIVKKSNAENNTCTAVPVGRLSDKLLDYAVAAKLEV